MIRWTSANELHEDMRLLYEGQDEDTVYVWMFDKRHGDHRRDSIYEKAKDRRRSGHVGQGRRR